MSFLERALIAVSSLTLSLLLIALLSGFFATRDRPALAGPPAPGVSIGDLAAQLPGSSAAIHRLTGELRAGDVVLVYSTRRPTRLLLSFVRSIVGQPTASLTAAGQDVVLAGRRRRSGLVGLAWRRMIEVANARDPRIRAFVSYWLGRGARASGP